MSYKLTFTEFSGEHEHSYDYFLPNAKTEKQAKATARKWLKDWYDGGKEIEDMVFEYDFGCIMVRKVYWQKCTKEEFTNELVDRFTLN